MKKRKHSHAVTVLGVLAVWGPGHALGAPAGNPVRAAVVPSQGTQNLSMTIWRELNAGWSAFGDTPVEIDWRSLPTSGITSEGLAATDADVLIISMAGTAFEYTEAEAAAIIDYVQAGHGLIVTYASIAGSGIGTLPRNQDLIPLLGMSEDLFVATNFWSVPLVFNMLLPDHPIFAGIDGPYASGVPYMVRPPEGTDWLLTTGVGLARANPQVLLHDGSLLVGDGLIVANDTDMYRSVFFPHYIEEKGAGANEQDMQVFYNALVWTSTVPEPGTCLLIAVGGLLVSRRRRESR